MFWLPLNVFLQFLSFTLKERWVEVVFVCLQSWYPLFSTSPLSLSLSTWAWRLWHPDRGSAWKQTAAVAPVTGPDRCAAGCRVAWRYRWMADRYHNHTSPLLSLTYWIKHLPSCSWIANPPPPKKKIWRLLEMSLRWVKKHEKSAWWYPTNEVPKVFFFISGYHLQIDRPAIWQAFVPGCCNRFTIMTD